jgi:hypothetical protein
MSSLVIVEVTAQLAMSAGEFTTATCLKSIASAEPEWSGGGVDGGVGGGGGAGGGGGVAFRSVSVPWMGPRQVVPVYGISSAVPLFRTVPMPFRSKLHAGEPARFDVPLATTDTVVALTRVPDAVPAIVTPPAHSAEKLPASEVAV